MLFLAERAFVGTDEKRAPLKTPAWGATQLGEGRSFSEKCGVSKLYPPK